MLVPVQITFRNTDPSEAVSADINRRIEKLSRQQGNIINGYVELVVGSTTTLPTSGVFATLPVATASRPILCQIEILNDGVGSYSAVGRIATGGSLIVGWRQADAGIDTLVTATSPLAIGTADVVRWTFSYALAGL